MSFIGTLDQPCFDAAAEDNGLMPSSGWRSDLMDKDEMVARAKQAEQAERYDDMAESMKAVVETGSVLSKEERQLLALAYEGPFIHDISSGWGRGTLIH